MTILLKVTVEQVVFSGFVSWLIILTIGSEVGGRERRTSLMAWDVIFTRVRSSQDKQFVLNKLFVTGGCNESVKTE